MRSKGSLTIIDSASALSFIFILLIVSFTYVNSPDYMLTVEMGYYKKVAEQILLASAMQGHFKELIYDLEMGSNPIATLTKMAGICPAELTCRLRVSEKSGLILTAFGALHDSTYGEAHYLITLKRGEAMVVCQVSVR